MEPRVKLKQGTYRGRHYPPTPARPKGLDIYLGIPYALSTRGEHRFRPARLIPASTGEGMTGDAEEFDAGALGFISPYTDASAEPVPSGEDCLSVNVVVPSSVRERAEKGDEAGEKRRFPVVVYFHGGAFNMGYGADRDMPSFVTRAGDLVAIGHHLLNEPPFQRAILESGAPTSRAVLNPQHPRHEGHFAQLCSELGIPRTDPTPLAKLRAVPIEELTRAAKRVWDANAAAVTWPFQPVIDGPGGYIPAPTLSLLEEGKGRGIPLITGFCTNEGSAFVPPMHSGKDVASFFKTLIPGLSAADLEALDALYPLDDFAGDPPAKRLGTHWKRTEAAYAHYAYIAPVLQTAMYLGKYAPVYVYEFAVRDAVLGMANHTNQTPYVTRLEAELEHEGQREVAAKMHGFFAEFLTGGEMEGWPRFIPPDEGQCTEADRGRIMVFGKDNAELLGGERGVACKVRSLGVRELERVRFWWERAGLSQGMGGSS